MIGGAGGAVQWHAALFHFNLCTNKGGQPEREECKMCTKARDMPMIAEEHLNESTWRLTNTKQLRGVELVGSSEQAHFGCGRPEGIFDTFRETSAQLIQRRH